MNAAEKIAHAAERKAFEAMLDSLIRKSQTKDVCTVANDFVNMVQKIHSSVWTPETFEMLHQIANDPDSKWAHYAERLLRECDLPSQDLPDGRRLRGRLPRLPAGTGKLREV